MTKNAVKILKILSRHPYCDDFKPKFLKTDLYHDPSFRWLEEHHYIELVSINPDVWQAAEDGKIQLKESLRLRRSEIISIIALILAIASFLRSFFNNI